MTKKEMNSTSPENELKPRLLIDLFVFTTLINGVISDRTHSRSVEMKTLSEKRFESPQQIYRVDLRNDTVYDENVLLSIGFDKMLHWVFDNEVEKGGRACGGRSLKFKLGERFAFRRRLQFALLPIMYKMGVMTTLLTGLTVLVLKGLTIGVILLIFAFGNYFTKLHKHSYQPTQPIHVHVHSQDGHGKVTSFSNGIGLGPWDRVADETNPTSLGDQDLESYRRRLIQNSAQMVKFRQLL